MTSGLRRRTLGALDTLGSSRTYQRQGRSDPLVSPMRVVCAGSAGGGMPSSHDDDPPVSGHEVGTVERAVEPERLAQLRRPAAQVAVAPGRGAGAAHRLQAGQRASARSSTATPSPSSPHTALAHQCMP